MLDFQIHWLELIAAAALRQVVGLVWYAPFVFGRSWATAHGCEPALMMRRAIWAWPVDALCGFVVAFVLAQVLNFAGMIDWLGGAVVGFLMWLGFLAAATPNRVLYAGVPLRCFLIDTGFGLVTLVAMGALIGSWHWGDIPELMAMLRGAP